MLVGGVAAAAADDLLAVGEGGARQPGLCAPAAVQLGQPPGVAVGQGPGGGVGAQHLDGRSVVLQGHPALDDIGRGAHPVVQRDGQVSVAEAEPQLAVLGVMALVGPLGAAPLGGAHGQGGPGEAGAALDRVLLAPVERGLEGPVVGQRPDGQGLGVGEADPGTPVQVQQFVPVGDMDGVTAGRPREHPCTTVFGDLQHQSLTDSNKPDQVRPGTNIIKGFGGSRQRLWTTHCPRQACRIVGWCPSTSRAGGADWEEPP